MSKDLEQKSQEYSAKTVDCGSERALSKQILIEYCQQDFKAGYELCRKEYEEKLRWIPVEEKLPEIYSRVLAVIKSPVQTWVEEIGFGETKFMLPGRGETYFVTHWMYVPEPPSFL